jgi:hypothetical protein
VRLAEVAAGDRRVDVDERRVARQQDAPVALEAIVSWAMPTPPVNAPAVEVVKASLFVVSMTTTSPAMTPPPDLFVSGTTTCRP